MREIYNKYLNKIKLALIYFLIAAIAFYLSLYIDGLIMGFYHFKVIPIISGAEINTNIAIILILLVSGSNQYLALFAGGLVCGLFSDCRKNIVISALIITILFSVVPTYYLFDLIINFQATSVAPHMQNYWLLRCIHFLISFIILFFCTLSGLYIVKRITMRNNKKQD